MINNNKSLRDEIIEFLRSDDPYQDNGEVGIDAHYCYNQIIKMIEKRIDELDTEYKLKVKGVKYQTGYYNALLDLKEMLK